MLIAALERCDSLMVCSSLCTVMSFSELMSKVRFMLLSVLVILAVTRKSTTREEPSSCATLALTSCVPVTLSCGLRTSPDHISVLPLRMLKFFCEMTGGVYLTLPSSIV